MLYEFQVLLIILMLLFSHTSIPLFKILTIFDLYEKHYIYNVLKKELQQTTNYIIKYSLMVTNL